MSNVGTPPAPPAPLRHALRWAVGIGLLALVFAIPLAAYL
jgi:hypothetical protein